MRIHALSTGTVAVKHSFLFAPTGPRRQLGLFLPSPWSDPLPVHCWAIEHDGRLLLVDTGETAGVRDIPFARFDVSAEQELPGALEAAGLSLDAVDTVVLTHMHGDHMDGAVHLRGPVLVHEAELAFTKTPGARFFQRVLRQPVPAGVDFQPFALDGGPFGAFPRSRPLTDDGRIVAVDTAGHTPGHVSVVCVDDEGRHVLLAGDATDTLEQLGARRADAVCPKPSVSIATIDRIIAHGRTHPTVYLPSHDPESVARLAAGTTLPGRRRRRPAPGARRGYRSPARMRAIPDGAAALPGGRFRHRALRPATSAVEGGNAVLIVLAVVMAAVWIGLFSLGMRFDRESSPRHLPASPEPGPDPDRTAAPAAVARP